MEIGNFVNNSGQGENIAVPEVVADKFNWGAFLLTWIWGLGNKTYITFLIFATIILAFVPILGFVAGMVQLGLSIWFGIKGNEWAWKNKQFESVEAFHYYQKKWAIAGTILAVLGILCSIVIMFVVMAAVMSGMPAD